MMKYIKVGTNWERCAKCNTPVVIQRGEALYCYGATFEVHSEGMGRKHSTFHAQEAITHNCDRDSKHYRWHCRKAQVLAKDNHETND